MSATPLTQFSFTEPVYRRHALVLIYGEDRIQQLLGDDTTFDRSWFMDQLHRGTLSLDNVLEVNYFPADADLQSLRDIPNVKVVAADGIAHYYCLRYAGSLQSVYPLRYTSSLLAELLLYPAVDTIMDDLRERRLVIPEVKTQIIDPVRLALKSLQVRDRIDYSIDRGSFDMTLPNGVRLRPVRRVDEVITPRHFLFGMGDQAPQLYRIDTPIKMDHAIDELSLAWEEIEMDIEEAFMSRGLITTISVDYPAHPAKE